MFIATAQTPSARIQVQSERLRPETFGRVNPSSTPAATRKRNPLVSATPTAAKPDTERAAAICTAAELDTSIPGPTAC